MDKFTDIKKLWDKIIKNSFYEPPFYFPSTFQFYSKEDAEKVTEEGKKAIRNMIKYFDK